MPTRIARCALIAAVAGLIGGLSGALVAQPAGRLIHPTAVSIGSTATDALDVSGGAQFGSGDVALVGTDGKLNGPLSTTILDDLSGVNLTSLNASNLGSGTVPIARLPTNVIVEVGLDTDTTETDSSTTTWVDTGLSVTLNIDDATNDATILAWQYIKASSGSANCELRIVKGTTPTVLVTVGVNGAFATNRNPHSVPMAYEDVNPGSGNVTYKTQVRRSGMSGTCSTEDASTSSVLWLYEIQD